MAAISVDAGSNLQTQIMNAVQPKLIENGWVDEESDFTLSEYVTMMIVNGKDLKGVQSELGGDLLGVGEEDAAVSAFAQWLFDTVRQLSAPQQPQQDMAQQQEQQTQPIPTVQDAQMEDSGASGDAPPTGPRSMRNGNAQGRGRGGRNMLGQMNKHMDRSNDLPDNLRRIKGASGIGSGRINSHATPRGPRGSNVANGLQRMMNGGRGGHQNNMGAMQNPMMGGPANPQQQMQFMQMMEMQTNMMAQLIASGNMPNMNGNFNNQRGGRGGQRGQRGGARGRGDKQLHAVNGKMPEGALPGSNTNAGGSGMDIDGDETNHGDKFSTLCRFNLTCTNPACGFAHQSPAAPPNAPVDLSDTCAHGAACTNHKCSARHPSPAQRSQNAKQEVDCKFYPNCTAGPNCPFRHPTEKPCRNGGDCTNPDCKFAHPKIMCRYNPCMNSSCMFKHAEGQKRGKFQDKVWTAGGGGEGGADGSSGKAGRFADFAKQTENGEEELVLPGQQNGGGGGEAMQTQEQEQQQTQQPQQTQEGSSSQQMETQVVV